MIGADIGLKQILVSRFTGVIVYMNVSTVEGIRKQLMAAVNDARHIDDKSSAVDFLMRYVESMTMPAETLDLGTLDLDPTSKLNLLHPTFGSASVSPRNFYINWLKLLAGGAGGAYGILSGTTSALSLLTLLATGAVYRFQDVDAQILLTIYENETLLPLSTASFLELVRPSLPASINDAAFHERIVKLANTGTISIDGDLLRITERFYVFKG